ncbi:MAG: hypothetical protein II871_01555 [Clostridia bacterium]|nr:hypothetical protein [Clostridia bacterium]
MIKRFLLILLAIAAAFSCACSGNNGSDDSTVFDLFMNAVKSGQYAEAYSFISEKTAIDNALSPSSSSAKTVTLTAFESFWSKFNDTLHVTDMEYKVVEDAAQSDSKRSIQYSVRYKCDGIDDLAYNCEIGLSVENGAWKLLWEPSCVIPELDWGESVARAQLKAQRGDILTKDGTVIATNEPLVTVYAVLSEIVDNSTLIKRIVELDGVNGDEAKKRVSGYLSKTESLHRLCEPELSELYIRLGELLEFSEEETPKNVFKSVINDFMTIKQFSPEQSDAEVLSRLEKIPGIRVDMKNYGSTRVYPYGSLMAHSLGYVGLASEDEVKSLNKDRPAEHGLYTTDSTVGKSGIERLYEKELRGKDGFYYYIKRADGTVKTTLFRHECENGLDVCLTVDFDLQKRTEELLDVVMFGENTAGAVIVMNPGTGEVDALASYPTYDLNKFILGFTDEEYKKLNEQENKPFVDRTVRGLYPPGSTFKVFTAAAALDTGTMTEDYIFTGRIVNDYWTPTGYGTWIWPRIKRTSVTNRTMPLNMANCMLHSDNIYFANAALKVGEDKLTEYLNGFGMSSALPFELTNSRSQIISPNERMNYKLLADTGYGQGQVLITPLQLATMFCALRNNGDLPTPRITDSMYKTSGVYSDRVMKSEYSTWLEDAVSENTIEKLDPMLEAVVDPSGRGTGRSLRVTNCDVAGKTGSAEIGADKSRIISWFAGYRLNVEEQDERVVVVMLEVPDTSAYSLLKFQIARELLMLDETPDPNAAPSDMN